APGMRYPYHRRPWCHPPPAATLQPVSPSASCRWRSSAPSKNGTKSPRGLAGVQARCHTGRARNGRWSHCGHDHGDRREEGAGSSAEAKTRQTMEHDGYRRELGKGLVLRWSTPEDLEGVVTLYAQVFRPSAEAPPGWIVPTWTRDMFSGRHPHIGP